MFFNLNFELELHNHNESKRRLHLPIKGDIAITCTTRQSELRKVRTACLPCSTCHSHRGSLLRSPHRPRRPRGPPRHQRPHSCTTATTSSFIMASINSVTRQLGALEISSKPNTQPGSTRPTHQKKPSQGNPNVAKLLSKFAAPHPYHPSHAKTASVSSLQGGKQNTRPPSPVKPVATAPAAAPRAPALDIGNYDGGLEKENETRGEKVYGEAAEELALDSSVSR